MDYASIFRREPVVPRVVDANTQTATPESESSASSSYTSSGSSYEYVASVGSDNTYVFDDDVDKWDTLDEPPSISKKNLLPSSNILNITFLFVCLCCSYYLLKRLFYKSDSTIKAQRRRQGIPDSDNRPWEIAHAAAVERRKKAAASQAPQYVSLARRTASGSSQASQPNGHPHPQQQNQLQPDQQIYHPSTLPSRRPEGLTFGVASGVQYGPNTTIRSRTSSGSQVYPFSFNQRPPSRADYQPAPSQWLDRPLPEHAHSAPEAPSSRTIKRDKAPHSSSGSVITRKSRKRLQLGIDGEEAFDDEHRAQADAATKRTRGNDWGTANEIDGDDQPRWALSHHSQDVRARPQKRLADQADDEDIERVHPTSGKRIRPSSSTEEDVPMPLSSQHTLMDRGSGRTNPTPSSSLHTLKDSSGSASPNSKERDLMSAVEPTRKNVFTRGTKREREEAPSTYGDDDSGAGERDFRRKDIGTKRKAIHRPVRKRGRFPSVPEEPEPRISMDPLCAGKKVGEQWEAGGTKFKVGSDGKRLRCELVKELKSKYSMPSDSNHQDTAMQVEVLVEKWLTEEEYMKAKEEKRLSWQQEEKPEIIEKKPQTPKRIASGWNATGLGHSTAMRASAGALNGFDTLPSLPQTGFGRNRLVSARSAFLPASSTTTSSRPPVGRGVAGQRWERQNREAEVLRRVRAGRQSAAATPEPSPITTTPIEPPKPVVTAITTPATTTPAFTLPSSTPASTSTSALSRAPTLVMSATDEKMGSSSTLIESKEEPSAQKTVVFAPVPPPNSAASTAPSSTSSLAPPPTSTLFSFTPTIGAGSASSTPAPSTSAMSAASKPSPFSFPSSGALAPPPTINGSTSLTTPAMEAPKLSPFPAAAPGATGFSFGAPKPTTTVSANPTNTATSSSIPNFFSNTAKPAISMPSSTLFSAPPVTSQNGATEPPKLATGLLLSQPVDNNKPATSGFTFGTGASVNGTSGSSTSFGVNSFLKPPSAPASTGFGFGQTAGSSAPASTKPSAPPPIFTSFGQQSMTQTTAPTTNGFTFGQTGTASSTPTASFGGFGTVTSVTKPTGNDVSTASPFAFGAPANDSSSNTFGTHTNGNNSTRPSPQPVQFGAPATPGSTPQPLFGNKVWHAPGLNPPGQSSTTNGTPPVNVTASPNPFAPPSAPSTPNTTNAPLFSVGTPTTTTSTPGIRRRSRR